MALLNCTRKPRFTWILPWSSSQGTRNLMIRSGSTRQSMTPSLIYSGFASTTGTREVRTSWTAWWNSGSAGFRRTTRSIRPFRYSF